MEEKRIIRLSILDEPVHGTKNVCLCRLAHRVLLIIREKNHIFTGISKVLVEVCRHVLNIIDTSSQLALLTEIVNSNQQCLSLSRTTRVLEVVTLRGAMTERDRSRGRSRWATTATLGRVVVCYEANICQRKSYKSSSSSSVNQERGMRTWRATLLVHGRTTWWSLLISGRGTVLNARSLSIIYRSES